MSAKAMKRRLMTLLPALLCLALTGMLLLAPQSGWARSKKREQKAKKELEVYQKILQLMSFLICQSIFNN